MAIGPASNAGPMSRVATKRSIRNIRAMSVIEGNPDVECTAANDEHT